MVNKILKAFTLAEVLIVLVLMSTTILLVMSSIKKIVPDKDVVMFKKAYSTLKSTVEELKSDEYLYPDSNGFKNVERVTIDGKSFANDSKFREAFKSRLNVYANNVVCPMLTESNTIGSGNICFMTTDGIVWGLPYTSFNSSQYYPITIFPKRFKKPVENAKQWNYARENALMVGIRYDGKIKILDNVLGADCKNEKHKKYVQCQAKDLIKTATVVKRDK